MSVGDGVLKVEKHPWFCSRVGRIREGGAGRQGVAVAIDDRVDHCGEERVTRTQKVGVDDAAVRGRLLNEFGVEIGAGLGPMKGKTWRVGLMGETARPKNVLLFLAALENCLSSAGYSFTPGASIAAANECYL